MPLLPSPVRAAVGLAATALEQVRTLPERAIELPMLAVSTALQLSLRAQQRYAQLQAKGDDVLNGRRTTDEPPPWATFDPPVAAADPVVDDTALDDTALGDSTLDDDVDPDLDTGTQTGTAAAPKAVRPRRDAAPSRFDAVGDDS